MFFQYLGVAIDLCSLIYFSCLFVYYIFKFKKVWRRFNSMLICLWYDFIFIRRWGWFATETQREGRLICKELVWYNRSSYLKRFRYLVQAQYNRVNQTLGSNYFFRLFISFGAQYIEACLGFLEGIRSV